MKNSSAVSNWESSENRISNIDAQTNFISEYIEKNGFYTSINHSRTSFGNSNYIYASDKENSFQSESKKIRISDHSVSNFDRLFNEVHVSYDSNIENWKQQAESILRGLQWYYDKSKYFYKEEVVETEEKIWETPESSYEADKQATDEIISKRIAKSGRSIITIKRKYNYPREKWFHKESGKLYTTTERSEYKQGGEITHKDINQDFGKATEFYERTYLDGKKERFSVDDYEKNIYTQKEMSKDNSYKNGGAIKKTSNGKQGGLLSGKRHSEGGIKAVVTDTNEPVELETGEVIIKREAVQKHWKELNRINTEAGGRSISKPSNVGVYEDGGFIDDDAEYTDLFEDYAEGGSVGDENHEIQTRDKDGFAIHSDAGSFGGVKMIDFFKGKKNLEDSEFREIYQKSKIAKKKFKDGDKNTMYSSGGVVSDADFTMRKKTILYQFSRIKEMIDSKQKGGSIQASINGCFTTINHELSLSPSLFPLFAEKVLLLPKKYRQELNIYDQDYTKQEVIDWLVKEGKTIFDVLPIEDFKTPKQKSFETTPKDDVFMSIHDSFAGNDGLRPIFMGTHFQEEGAVTTDAHILLFTPYRNGATPQQGEFCHTKKCIESNGAYSESKKYEGKFPNWEGVVPRANISYSVDSVALYNFLKNVEKFQLHNQQTRGFCLNIDGDTFGFNVVFLIEAIDALAKLGHKEIDFSTSTPNRVVILFPKGKAYSLNTDFALVMPIMLLDSPAFVFDIETNCVVDSAKNLFCFDFSNDNSIQKNKTLKPIKTDTEKEMIQSAIDDLVLMLQIIKTSKEEKVIGNAIKQLNDLKQII